MGCAMYSAHGSNRYRPLNQHLGAPSQPVVKIGDRVQRGDLIARIPEGKLGANVHASISGRVEAVTGEHVVIAA